MMRLFSVQAGVQLDGLLQDFRVLNPKLSEGEACKLKFSNRSNGVPVAKQKEIDGIVHKINQGQLDNEDDETLLKVIDVLTLYSNHLDQQTSDKENPKLEPKQKEGKVLSWLEAAHKIAQKLIPNIDSIMSENKPDGFLASKPQVLSSISQMLHYLGKARRYNPEITLKDRLPLLTAALFIGKHLDSLLKDNKELNDIHYYSGRVATFQIAVVYGLRELGLYDKALEIMTSQLQHSLQSKDNFHVIQSYVQLSEIAREQYEKEHKDITPALNYAEKAIQVVQDATKTPSEEQFTRHCIYFNARVAMIKAYKVSGDMDHARSLAETILSDNERDSNCGAKPWHIDLAKEVVATSSHSLTC